MVPPRLASEAFRLFMAIPTSRIEAELAIGHDNYQPARQRLSAYYAIHNKDRTAQQCAEYMHNQMIQACAAVNHPSIHEAVAFHFVGAGARIAAQTALFAASTTGELGKLNKQMDQIREASGNEEFDELPEEEQPPEYVEMADRASELLKRIERMLMIDILKRYALFDHAELFEANEAMFDLRVREGYYILFSEKKKG
jgi:hypothetical protein